jgi:uracil-DNA glycosylase
MLVGQAPGVLEASARKPFAGRSGAELARWMKRAGFRDDAHFRSLTYMTSITKCFPGKAAGGGDRRPSGVEAQQCAEWLEGQLRLQEPLLILVVGTLAQARFLPGRTLESLVGHLFDRGGVALRGADVSARPTARRLPYLLPLPHPSGASRWLNDAAHKQQLARALRLLQRVLPRLADG